MPEGFEYDPATVHARVEALRTPTTKATDFGASWTGHGTDFLVSVAVLAEDLTHLPPTISAIGSADTAPLRDLPDTEADSDPDTEADTGIGEVTGESGEIVGGPLDERVAALADLDLDPAPDTRRAELRGLHFGHLREDLGRLDAMADALAGLAGGFADTTAAGTLTDYATALRTAVARLRRALAGTHRRLVAYRDDSLGTHLDLGEADPAAAKEKVAGWYRATDDLKSEVDGLLAPALAGLRTVVAARPFSADRQLLALGRQVTIVEGGVDHVTVTVADGSGDPAVHDLDFDAASGLAAAPAGTRPSARRVPAATNGKCVFEHGGVTVTVERDLFDAATVTLTVDDGVAGPSTHTLAVPAAPVLPRVPEQAGGSDEVAAAGIGWSVHGDLFDTRDPVHSVHGVLVLDDRPAN